MLKSIAHSISPASEVNLARIPSDFVDAVWPSVEGFLLRSYRKSDQNIPITLRDDLRKGSRQLWVLTVFGSSPTSSDVTIVAAGVTSIFALRSGLALKIEHLGGGSLRNWLHLLKDLEAYARDRGCKKLMWEGRDGWKKLFPDYHVSAVVMEKRLDDDG
jgi:hypothetical protein